MYLGFKVSWEIFILSAQVFQYSKIQIVTCRLCPMLPRLARPLLAAPQANAGRPWLAGKLAMARGSKRTKFQNDIYEK
jgi:hypothetical protein